MHVFKHPKFYEDMRKKRKQFQKEQKQQASSSKPQATSYEQQASSNKRLMWTQSSSAKQGVSRWSVSRPRIEELP